MMAIDWVSGVSPTSSVGTCLKAFIST